MKEIEEEKLGLKELVAIGVGGMIGGGIFSVIGIAGEIAGNATPFVFVVGSLVAFFTGYSYVKLALTFKEDGASYIYLKHAFPAEQEIAGFTGWSVITGYVGTLALYSYTFGAYGAAMLGFENNYAVRTLLGLFILSAFLYINLKGVKSAGESEDILVYLKIFILLIFGVVGLFLVNPEHFKPLFNHGIPSVFLGGAIVFVAFEGFQLITNSVVEAREPEKNLPLGVYLSIGIVSVIYILLAITVMGVLSFEEILRAKEFAVAEAMKPIFGDYGFAIVSLAALLATSSAINSTLFGASRMMADIARDRYFPPILARKTETLIPKNALLFLFILSALFLIFGRLEAIVAFSSMTFLLVSLAVAIANFRLRGVTNANLGIVLAAIALITTTIVLMIIYLLKHEIDTLLKILFIYISAATAFVVYRIKIAQA
jgi:amino acid transporter